MKPSVYPNTRQIAALILFLIVAFFQLPCFSATVNLSWDQNNDASYYIVYWGVTSRGYTFNSQPSPSTTFTVTVDDGPTYYFAVKAFNDYGNSSDFSDEVAYSTGPDLSPPPTNLSPVADAGSDQSVGGGQLVSLNGAGSSDPDDGIASYQWNQISGTAVTLSNPTSATSSFTAPATGTVGLILVFRLTVKDHGGLVAYDDCMVTVSTVNDAPTANAGADQSVDEGQTVTLNGAGSSDPDDGIASYQWSQISGTAVTLSNPTSATSSFTAPATGPVGLILVFRLTVKDHGGLVAYDDCMVTVANVNEPPYADAGPDQTVDEGQTVTLNAGNSNDPDDGIASYVWFQTQGPGVILSSNTAITPTFTAPEASTEGLTLTFQLVVEDSQGGMSADTCDIHVNDTAIVEYPDAPVSPEYATTTLNEFPTIEVLDTNFQHRFWLKIGWAEYTALSGEARVATGDIDGDGEHEIIIGLGQVPDNPSIPGGFFQVLDNDYSHMAWGYVNWPEYNAINGETWPACGDIDGDGDDEIIIGLGPGGEGTMEVFDYDQGDIYHQDWIKGSWPEYNTVSGEIRPACGDIDQDGKDEIIAGLGPVNGVPDMPGGYFEVIDSTFSHIMWGDVSWPDYNALNGETRPASGNISGIGLGPDIILIGLGEGGGGRSQMFELASNNALIHTTWIQVDWPEYNDLSGETRPALADIDQDGKDEILTGLGSVRKSRSIPDGMFQSNDDSFSLLTWGQVSWSEYNLKNGETRLSYGIVQGTPSIFVSLGSRQEKTTGSTKPPPGKSK